MVNFSKNAALACRVAGSALLVCATAGSATEQHRATGPQFGFSVRFPAPFTVCPTTTDGRAQGFRVRLDARFTRCDPGPADPRVRAISVYAHGTAGTVPVPADPTPGPCSRAGNPQQKVDRDYLKGLAFIGRHPVSCAVTRTDRSIDVFVVYEGGDWPIVPAEDDGLPWVKLTAALHTTPGEMERDLPLFLRVLDSVRISSHESDQLP